MKEGLAENTSKLSSNRIPEIDGLRGLAIIGVLIAHFQPSFVNLYDISPSFHWLSLVSYGGMGVYLFFVISGFLIGGILIDKKKSDNYFKVFYLRRTLRIFPIYYLLLTLFFCFVVLRNNGFIDVPEWIEGFEFSSKWYFTYTQNIKMALIDKIGTPALAPTWSLAVEEQFYLILPFIVKFVSLRSLKLICYFSIVFGVVFRLSVWFLFENKTAANWLLPGCLDSLMIGVLLAIWMRNPVFQEFFKNKRKVLKVLFPVSLFFSIFINPVIFKLFNSPQMSIQIINPLSFNIFFVMLMILGLTANNNSWLSKILSYSILRKIGVRSYFIYLTHTFIFHFITWIFGFYPNIPIGTGWLVVTSVSLTTILVLAEFSWRFFEKPLIDYGHRFQYKK